jgi:PAS domain S-box-containing protein
VNPALCVALGRPAEALTTMRWQDVVVPADLAAVEQAVARALAGEGVEIAVRARRPDGAEVDLRIIARALQGSDRRIVAHVEDRTQRLADEVTLEAIVGRSRALLRQLIDNAPNVIAVKDRQSRYRLLNRLGAVIFGREPDEVLGLTDHDLLDAEAAAANHAEDVRTMAAGRPLTFLKDVRMPDGTVRPYLTTKFPIRGPDGGSEGVGVIAVDMSEIRQAEADRARLGALAEAAPDAIVITDSEGTIANWNPGAEPTFGLAPDEAVGRSYEETVVPDEDRHTYRRVRRDLEYGRARTVRMGARRADGSVFPAQVSAAALHDGAGTVVIVRDISDLVAAQRELERSNAELERFAIAASHDLQEPLRTIRMGAETVMHAASERLDDDERDLLAHVEQAADRMSSQVTALMNVARVALEDGPEEVTPLQRALDDALLALEAAVRESDAHIDVAGRLPVVAVPRAEMALILQNLLSNAIKFRRAGERPSVVLRAREANGVVELRVADNGIGLTEAAAAKIFGLFERDRTGVPGTGVGLAVCRQILDRRGGSISVSSGGPGQGAAFTLRLRSA